jgi:AcrR family transcriptional regulator
MANPRFARLDPERRDALLSAAADEFTEHGYAASSVNRIIERAGSSKGSVYYYFENKADLLATVVEEAYDWILAEAEWPRMDVLTADTFWSRLFEVTRTSTRVMSRDTWQMRVLRSFYRLREEPAARAATAGLMDRGRRLISDFLRTGQDLGVVRTDLPTELLVEMYLAADTAGDRWTTKHWDDFTEEERARMFVTRFHLVRDMLNPSQTGGG